MAASPKPNEGKSKKEGLHFLSFKVGAGKRYKMLSRQELQSFSFNSWRLPINLSTSFEAKMTCIKRQG
jgi:hypothetical protein